MPAKISVIVAVYGVEPWIEASLRSLLSQTLAPDQMEVILIDDASPDRSMEIALRLIDTEFPAHKPYVKIIRHRRNLGVSQTRQDGIDAATGAYIIHFDPDDTLAPEAYATMLAEAERSGADITLCDFDYVNEAGSWERIFPQRPRQLTAECLLRQMLGQEKPQLHGSFCNKLIRSELYRQVCLPEGLSLCEDLLTVCNMLSLPDVTISSTDRPFYRYVQRSGSLVTRTDYTQNLRLFDLMSQERHPAFATFIGTSLATYILPNFHGSAGEFASTFGRFLPYADSAKVSAPERLMLRRALQGRWMAPRLLRRLGPAIRLHLHR